ncbi:hypothetical protein WAI453_000843 [Rhynchosporium graminicola]
MDYWTGCEGDLVQSWMNYQLALGLQINLGESSGHEDTVLLPELELTISSIDVWAYKYPLAGEHNDRILKDHDVVNVMSRLMRSISIIADTIPDPDHKQAQKSASVL